MVTGVVVEIIAVIIVADAYATITASIIAVIIAIAAVVTVMIGVLIHVPEKEKKLMRQDLEMAVIMLFVGMKTAIANDIYKKRAVRLGRLIAFYFKYFNNWIKYSPSKSVSSLSNILFPKTVKPFAL